MGHWDGERKSAIVKYLLCAMYCQSFKINNSDNITYIKSLLCAGPSAKVPHECYDRKSYPKLGNKTKLFLHAL